jgi:transcriptional regulator with XRE-family HTH domain
MTARPGLAAARRKAGFTQQGLADVLGVRKGTVCGWETGATGINASRRPAIAAALDISLSELDRLIAGEQPNVTAFVVSSTPESTWEIDVDRLPRRFYAAVPPAASEINLDHDGPAALIRVEQFIEQLTANVRLNRSAALRERRRSG